VCVCFVCVCVCERACVCVCVCVCVCIPETRFVILRETKSGPVVMLLFRVYVCVC